MKSILTASVEIKIPFYDLDPMQVVWHGNYVKYFEKARCELLSTIDFDYEQMQAAGYMWPVVEMQLKYVRPARFGQIVRCEASMVEYENRIRINYLIRCIDSGQKLTAGFTKQVAVNLSSGEMELVSPPILLQKLGVIAADE